MAADKSSPAVTLSQGYTLKDGDGNIRGQFVVRDGASTLELLDQAKVPRLVLSADKDLSGVFLFDGNRKRRASLAMDTRGRLGLQLYDQDEVRRADLGAGRTSFGLRLFDPGEKQRAIFSAGKDGGALMFGDKSGNDRASFCEFNGQPAIIIMDEKGKILFAQPRDP
jgi:hypothetical protein